MHVSIPDLDLAAPTGRDERGRPFWSVRCRVPMAFDASFRDVEVRDARAVEVTVTSDEGTADADGTPERARGTGPTVQGPVIEGIASSTGVDSYGTEMSEQALEDMAGQFRGRGVVYLPQHPGLFSGGGEWDDVMGYVVDAEILRGAVPSQADAAEPGFLLRVRVQLDAEHPKTAPLTRKLKAGHTIGQSIGGWFTKLRFVYPDGTDPDEAMAGWVMPERVIVEGVELDHLAATRAPANRESYIEGVRTALREQAERTRKRGETRRDPGFVLPPPGGAVPLVPEPIITRSAAQAEEAPAETAPEEEASVAARGAFDAPSYRPQTSGSAERCDRCVHFQRDDTQESAGGQCTKFNFLTRGEYTCDDWAEDPENPSATHEDYTASAPVAPVVRKATIRQIGPATRSAPKYAVGDQVTVTGTPHVEGHTSGEIVIVSSEPVYGIVFEGSDEVHKWYVESELAAVENGADESAEDEGTTDKPVGTGGDEMEMSRAAPEGDTRSNSALDTEAAAAHDANVNTQVGHDAPGGAPADTATTPSTEERSMPDSPTIDQRLDALTRAVEGLVAKQTPASDAAPPPPETPEQRRIRELETQLASVLSEPVRRGFVPGHLAPHEMESSLDVLVAEADTQGRSKGLVAVCRSARIRRTLTEADGAAKTSKADLEQALRAVLNAGESDGHIAAPNDFATWDRR